MRAACVRVFFMFLFFLFFSIVEKMDGVMLIVTSAGKIVFISHNIEKVLGHTQVSNVPYYLELRPPQYEMQILANCNTTRINTRNTK